MRRRWGRLSLLAGLMFVPAMLLACGGDEDDDGEQEPPEQTATEAPAETADPEGPLGPDPSIPRSGAQLGDPDAPLEMEEFVDYQCPNCRRYVEEIEPQLIDEYVATGDLSIVVRNFTILGEESVSAALAAECAVDQDLYWQYRDLLFGAQTGENVGDFTVENLKALAAEVPGIDQAAFDACLDDEDHLSKVEMDYEEAQAAGLTGTPGFIILGEAISGSPTIESWRQILDSVLP